MKWSLFFRGVKELLWEGGTRGAGFVWSPLLKKHTYISNHMVIYICCLGLFLYIFNINMYVGLRTVCVMFRSMSQTGYHQFFESLGMI